MKLLAFQGPHFEFFKEINSLLMEFFKKKKFKSIPNNGTQKKKKTFC
jgi:hypothetical protein